jgi:hypothetical protein
MPPAGRWNLSVVLAATTAPLADKQGPILMRNTPIPPEDAAEIERLTDRLKSGKINLTEFLHEMKELGKTAGYRTGLSSGFVAGYMLRCMQLVNLLVLAEVNGFTADDVVAWLSDPDIHSVGSTI